MDYIQLKKRDSIKRFGIRTTDGEDTGEYIEFDMEDLDLPIKANQCQLSHVENYNNLKKELEEANQKSDEKGEHEIISEKEKATIEALKRFYEAEEKALDGFIGKGATKKLLGNGEPYLTMYDDINDYLKQILPTIKDAEKSLESRIKDKYGIEKEDNIL